MLFRSPLEYRYNIFGPHVGAENIGPRVFGPGVGQERDVNGQPKTDSAGKLATGKFKVDWANLSAFLGRVDTNIDDSKAASLISAYFQQSGVQAEVLSEYSVFANRGFFAVRTDTNTLELISQLMAPFAPVK